MFPATLLTTLLLALFVSANPIVSVRRSPATLSISRQINSTGPISFTRFEQRRARTLKAHGKKHAGIELTPEEAALVNEPTDNQGSAYIASVGVGNPPTTYQLLVDTGSSNTWVGAGQPYIKTSASIQTSNRVSVTYGSGQFSGTEFTDTVTLGTLSIENQSIGVAEKASGFDGLDGILGIGPAALTLGTLSPASNEQIPTVTDNLFSEGLIPANQIGIFFEPFDEQQDSMNGEITWGGVDQSKLAGSVEFTPRTSSPQARSFWGIDQSIAYGETQILGTTAGIVDTGTTLILMASDALRKYMQATGAVQDDATGLLSITQAQFQNLQSLFFTTNGVTYELTANAQIWPRSLNTAIGGDSNSIYLVIGDIGSPSGEGFDFINGFAFLQRFYSVFNNADGSVGFAPTSFTTATTN